ncbi:MAG: CIA30 family protein [Flavobacteriales bacterium]|jgi:NADH dehydrogenase [ubiquinone] 1 alpha subcomplex assembly factor 1
MVLLQSPWLIGGALALGAWWWFGSTPSRVATSDEQLTVNFSAAARPDWRSLDDNVMGGLSEGRVTWNEDGMRWVGQTRLENNGGFSSVRSEWALRDLSGTQRIIIRCRGNGGPFKLVMERNQRWWMPYLYASFTPTDSWTEVVIPFEKITWNQPMAGDLPSVGIDKALADVLRLGFMKYDGTAQSFELEVAELRFE